ncbi:hypothetical protein N8772_03740 [Rickettsiales bacterium]|nr:hypothetical protein [Rickettsiales bacterium]
MFRFFLIITLFLFSFNSNSSRQGNIGHNFSEGEVDIDLGIGNIMGITGIDDMIFEPLAEDHEGDLEMIDQLCVYSNDGGNYAITAHGINDNRNNFYMSNNSETLRYYVYWDDNLSGNVNKRLRPSRLKRNLDGSQDIINDCNSDNENARIRVRIRERDLNNITEGEDGDFIDTLTITLSAN